MVVVAVALPKGKEDGRPIASAEKRGFTTVEEEGAVPAWQTVLRQRVGVIALCDAGLLRVALIHSAHTMHVMQRRNSTQTAGVMASS
jgi:hypothetical protein